MRCFSTCFKRCKKIYRNTGCLCFITRRGKYYVGESMDVDKRIVYQLFRISAHKKEKVLLGQKTMKLSVFYNQLRKKQESFWELKEIFERFKLHGIENVRGSMFTSPYGLTRNDKYIAGQLYCELNNLCRKCGSPDHFIGNCKSTEVADWVTTLEEPLISKEKMTLEGSALTALKILVNFPNISGSVSGSVVLLR